MTKFYIADFEIDLSRSVVIKADHETQVEPKVLKVLYFLAQQQNKVVTHKEIMAHVWQGTEVVPNALQRCIAILRKVFNDDAKSPKIIATHPRIGYRLLATVHWPPEAEIAKKAQVKIVQPLIIDKRKLVATVAVLVISLLAVFVNVFWPNNFPKQYTKIQKITQTDAYETHAVYAPDAKYLIFNRFAGDCKSHLWARHIVTGEESQLTLEPGFFGRVSFTSDGRELVFAAKNDCVLSETKPAMKSENQQCWNIATLDFALAVFTPQVPNFRHQCQTEQLKKPIALSNHQYAFLQYLQGRYQLVRYDDLSKKLTTIYRSKQQYIYHFDYDRKHNRFVTLSRNENASNVLNILDEQGQVLNSAVITLAPSMSASQQIYADFEPQGTYLLAVVNKRLFKIALDGKVQLIDTPENNLISVAQHPKTHDILAVTGSKDIDIAQVTIADGTEFQTKAPQTLKLTATAAQQRNAQYQPNGEYIAFVSDSSGADQLWLWHEGYAAQFSFLTADSEIRNFSWSPDGKKLAWIANDQITISDLNGRVTTIDIEKPVDSVLQWFTDNQLLLRVNGTLPNSLYIFDLTLNRLSAVATHQVDNAWIHQEQLMFSDKNGGVYTRPLYGENTEVKPLPLLNGKALFIKDNFIYSVDKKSLVLNQYDLSGQLLKPILPLKANAWKATGLSHNNVLLSQFVAINHDIVILRAL